MISRVVLKIVTNQTRFKRSILGLDLCDFSDAYIAVKGTITVTETSSRSQKKRPLAFKNNAPFISCISKINNTLINNAEDLDVVIHMSNLLKYGQNYSKTMGSLCNYYRDESIDDTNNINIPNKNVINSESFKYKTSVTGSTYNVHAKITNTEGNEINNPAYDANKSDKKEVEIAVPLKYEGDFWRILDMPLITCEVSLILTWSKKCVITSMERRVITNTRRKKFH